jgi:hypothetical protein
MWFFLSPGGVARGWQQLLERTARVASVSVALPPAQTALVVADRQYRPVQRIQIRSTRVV